MFPQPISRSEFRPDDSHPDPIRILEQHILAGFPPDLALDLVLNELVVRAAEATHATAAALALLRNDEMVCRAATGHLAPDLGVPLNTREGLSGACLQTRQAQLSVDTEFDPRLDPAVSRHLGIRSILIVPVFDLNNQASFAGVLEVFSTSPAAFSSYDQKLLEGFAEECARIRQAALELSQRQPDAQLVVPEFVEPELVAPDPVVFEAVLPESTPPELVAPEFYAASLTPVRRPSYEAWTLILGGLAILAIIAVSFLIGSRIGWLRFATSQAEVAQPLPSESAEHNLTPPAAVRPPKHSSSAAALEKTSRRSPPTPAPPAAGQLVVYEKGKVIFRLKSAPATTDSAKNNQARLNARPDSTRQDNDSVRKSVPTTKIAASASVWISPDEAGTRLLTRTEPYYPPAARAAHRSGNVVLEVQVAEDGSVSKIRTLSGDPVLAAAAKDAVRNWRYQPYRQNDHPTQFQTDVTLSFALPN